MTKASESKRLYFYQRAKIATVKGTERNRSLFRGSEGPLAELQSNDTVQVQLLATENTGSVIRTMSTERSEPLAYMVHGHSSSLPSDQASVGFNGELIEAFNFYILGAGYRVHSPTLMRLLSPDNLSPFAQGGINSYAYCGGDPVNFSDPSGHNPYKIPPYPKVPKVITNVEILDPPPAYGTLPPRPKRNHAPYRSADINDLQGKRSHGPLHWKPLQALETLKASEQEFIEFIKIIDDIIKAFKQAQNQENKHLLGAPSHLRELMLLTPIAQEASHIKPQAEHDLGTILSDIKTLQDSMKQARS
ncbi:MAG: RHS repeat-associated core domain-containing protein [Pseudomonas kermanshahensis]|uniref:RHS repeat-associated core domain-containing protein n=1 Tax=Pseudomonas kermanshahensis TaxID=2745482 RepID=UPI003D0F5139